VVVKPQTIKKFGPVIVVKGRLTKLISLPSVPQKIPGIAKIAFD
jgi:hypothetical protein